MHKLNYINMYNRVKECVVPIIEIAHVLTRYTFVLHFFWQKCIFISPLLRARPRCTFVSLES